MSETANPTRVVPVASKSIQTNRHLEAELYNLWPAFGLVNQAHSNYRFAALNGTKEFFGCAISIDSKARKVEPAPEARGVVARAHLFIAEQYGIPLSPSQRTLFEAWDVLYPPTSWELEWARRVGSIEGYENRFITQREYVSKPITIKISNKRNETVPATS